MTKKRNKVVTPKWTDIGILGDVIKKRNFDFIEQVNKQTANWLTKVWTKNIEDNVDLWKRHSAFVDDCIGIGKDKAVVGVGAGSSFNNNSAILKKYLNRDGVRNWEDRSFITIASNHQYKPLLEMGIIPDFVLLCDGSDVVYDQLTKDIPESGKNTVLITGMHCSPKVLHEWSDQGRDIRFFVNKSDDVQSAFKKATKKYSKKYVMELGGNVMNGAWAISIRKMHSNVFLAVGNDLSYKIDDDMDKQRGSYYADGDYSTNDKVTGTGRDEAARFKKWLGFNISKRMLFDINEPLKGIDRYDLDLQIVGTSHTLWVYKVWLEATLLGQTLNEVSFHYFNCSEGGILGVMAKEDTDQDLRKEENWYMLDDICRFYHTAILEDAILHFEKCKEIFECQRYDAQNVGGLVVQR